MTPKLNELDIFNDDEENEINSEKDILAGLSSIGRNSSRQQAARELEKAYANRFSSVTRVTSMKNATSISDIPSRPHKRKDHVLQDSSSDSHASCSQPPSCHQPQHSKPKVSPSTESGVFQLANKSKKSRKYHSGSHDQSVGRHSKHIEILAPVPEQRRQNGDNLHANRRQQHQILPKHVVVRERRAPKKPQREDILVRIMKQQMMKKMEKLRMEEGLHRL